MHSQVGRASDSERACKHFAVQYCGNNENDGQHVSMRPIRDEDHYCYIIGISTVASSFCFVTIVLFWCCAFVVTVHFTFVCSVTQSHHFAVAGSARHVLHSRQAVQRGPRWTKGRDAVTQNEVTKLTTVQCLNVQRL